MTAKQNFIKAIYPLFSALAKLIGINSKVTTGNKKSAKNFYELTGELANGDNFSFEQYRSRKILIVNTASDCGYTPQYEGLEELYKQYADKLLIVAFPSNDFKEQEKGDDASISTFCKVNFGVSFPIMKKTIVKKHANQHPIYNWLTQASANGWNDAAPSWNFCKYLINENGQLTHVFQSGIEPMSKTVLNAINN
jgi:glutathione peroxidase